MASKPSRGGLPRKSAPLPAAANSIDALQSLAIDEAGGRRTMLLGTRFELFEIVKSNFVPVDRLNNLLGSDKDVRQVAVAADGRVAVAAGDGLFLRQSSGNRERPNPVDGVQAGGRGCARRRFRLPGPSVVRQPGRRRMPRRQEMDALHGARGVAVQRFHDGRSRTGEGRLVWNENRCDPLRWFDLELSPGTSLAPGRRCAFDGRRKKWRRVVRHGAHGVGRLERRPTTLAEKAALFETMIDKYHRRTPYGYVCDVHLPHPADLSEVRQHDDDNDGLWTGMYGEGECFAYAATHDPLAKNGPKPPSRRCGF